ncbi:polyprenyl synthetase family protein [Streptomyces sp. L7]
MTVVGPFGLSVRDQALEADVQAGMAAVEEGLLEATKSEVPFITEAAQHLVRAGGKRFRPLLVMLAAQFGDPYAPGVVPSAVVVELTHLATLYHDDVMDEAAVRRGWRAPTPAGATRSRSSPAIFSSRARRTPWPTSGPRRCAVQAEAFERLVTGQILETAGPSDGRDPVEHYLDVLGGKTGSLVAVACRFGAMMAGCEDTVVDVLTQYGERLGVAFQLADDVLDIASDGHESGKTPGTGPARGHPHPAGATAPGAGEDRLGLAEDIALCRTARLRPHRTTTGSPRPSPGSATTRPWSRPAATPCATREDARAALAPLPECDAKVALLEMCDAVVHRAG